MVELASLTEIERDDEPSADAWSCDLTGRGGYRFHVRPAGPSDEAALTEFFTHVTPDDLRFRFLSAVYKVGHRQLEALVNVDHRRTENFLAFDPDTGTLVATGMMAADEALAHAEVAISIRSDFKDHGIGWMLLEHITHFAAARGIKTLESIESRDNHQAIELEREMGFKAQSCPGDATLVLLRATLERPEIGDTVAAHA